MTYFGTLGGGSDAGWLKALTFDTLVRTWTSVTPGETMVTWALAAPTRARARLLILQT